MRRSVVYGTIAATLATGTVFVVTSADGSSTKPQTIGLYEHDTSQASIDLGDKGDSPGDQFIFAGDTSDKKGAAQVGRAAGVCTTVSTGSAGEVICVVSFSLPGGQIAGQGLFVASELFGGTTVGFPITGGTGRYRHARGQATVEVPQDVPDLTDANFVLRVL